MNFDQAKAQTKQIEVLICTPTILAKYEPHDYPKIKTVATAGEPTSQRYIVVDTHLPVCWANLNFQTSRQMGCAQDVLQLLRSH